MRRTLQWAITAILPVIALSIVAFTEARAEGVPQWQTLLEKIVNINSGTRNIEGLDANRQVLIPEFEKLGFAVTTH
ncbi:MAG: M20 family metallopeptidase, partial [Hyphomicrobiales bacterium]|nr:M20 family metallopeptidase [Hyphomicrobiales bacterium]